MKIRSGFVSNSSSSSFVILLPENFLDVIDYDKITNKYEDFPLDGFKDLLKMLIDNEELWYDSIYEYCNTDEFEDFDFPDHLDKLVKPYVIAEVEGGPDEGKIIIANKNKINEILNNK